MTTDEKRTTGMARCSGDSFRIRQRFSFTRTHCLSGEVIAIPTRPSSK